MVVQRQVALDQEREQVAKLQLKPWGTYIVIRRVNLGSYIVQKFPFEQGTTRQRGKERKVKAGLMEKLPSTLCVYKRVDGVDMRFGSIQHRAVTNPLEPNLGVHSFGCYQQNQEGPPEERQFAYKWIQDMWQVEVTDSSDEENEEEDGADDKNDGHGEENGDGDDKHTTRRADGEGDRTRETGNGQEH